MFYLIEKLCLVPLLSQVPSQIGRFFLLVTLCTHPVSSVIVQQLIRKLFDRGQCLLYLKKSLAFYQVLCVTA
ncbi:hypothetical protein F4778DRAFT_755777 [Xylariomycetidae sp. FL2044]|nr:hypothetical protein F4778DRAFT_755777 [Xylariomycetidae sp. FL2044]